MNEYLEKFVNETEANHASFERLREYATKNKVPIIKRESLVAINCLLSLKNAKRVLERMKNIRIKGNKINIEKANTRRK